MRLVAAIALVVLAPLIAALHSDTPASSRILLLDMETEWTQASIAAPHAPVVAP